MTPAPDGGAPRTERRFDVVIIGGGPAGAAAGRLLASWGRTTLLLTRTPGPHPSLGESLPPSCCRVLDSVGLGDAVAAAGFLETDGNNVSWGPGPPRETGFAGGRVGYQVERRVFDEVLLVEAERAGVVVRRHTSVRTVRPASGDDGPVSTVATVGPGGRGAVVQARVVLDCSGRAGVVAQPHRLRRRIGPRTVALVGVWSRAGGWPARADHRTVVEAYADGWAWSVPVTPRRRYLTVMIDPRAGRMSGDRLAARYLAEVAKTGRAGATVRDARLQGTPWVLDASLYTARQFGQPEFLLVGDAATFIDPLSSFGVKKAIASAYVAATTANTMLTDAVRVPLALEFHTTHEATVFEHYRRRTTSFYRDSAAGALHPFWADRAAAEPFDDPFDEPSDAGHTLVARLRRDPEVVAAFDALRRAPAIRLRTTGHVPTTRRPAIAGREIVAEPRFVLDPPAGVPVRIVGGVDLVALAGIAPRHAQVPDLYAAYQEGWGRVGLPDFLGALSVLLGKRVLRNDADGG